jgi:hypothetical protein
VDLLALAASLRRHRIVTLVMLVLTLVGAIGVLKVMPRDFNAYASYVLVNPVPPPTDRDVASNPSLAQGNSNNPYLRFASEGTVGQVLVARLSGDAVRQALVGEGADPGYTVSQSPNSLQIMDLVGTGRSAQEAEKTLELMSDRVQAELHAMQQVYGADDSTLITVLPVAPPTDAHLIVSGTVRTLVGVVAAGVLVLFAAISLAEARRRIREETDGTAVDGTPGGGRPRRGASVRVRNATGGTGLEEEAEQMGEQPQSTGARYAATSAAPL